MAKMMARGRQIQRQQSVPSPVRAPKRGKNTAAREYFSPRGRPSSATTAPVTKITVEQYPNMSPSGRAFLRRMEANPHVDRAMRDLADK